MKKRQLGRSGLKIAPLAFGGNVFGWTINEAESFSLLDTFVSSGFNLIDTADVYSTWAPSNVGGESEAIIGNWLKRSGARGKVVIATKVGQQMGPDQLGLSKNYILKAVEASLKRLQTDYIDLYQSHRDDPSAPLEETLEAFALLIEQGKIRSIGASNFSGPRLEKALETSRRLGLPSYSCLQPRFNLFDRSDYEEELESVCVKNGVGVICYSSLASGFLTGKYRAEIDLAKSARGSGVKKYLTERGFRILKALDDVSTQFGATPAQIAIAWLVSRSSVTAPIASATSLSQLNVLMNATQIELSRNAIECLDKASERD